MAFGNFLDDDTLESLADGDTAFLRTEVVGPQANISRTPPRTNPGTYSVPTVGPANDFESTGPFVREGDGVASRVRVNPELAGFPSLGQDDPDGMKAGRAHLRGLMKAQRLYAMNLAARDPQAAGMALADLDGMRDGFGALVGEGWNGKEAAHVLGAVGRVFGGYGNAVENAKQLKRFADTRGVDLQTAGNELWSLQKNFGAGYLTDYGFTGKVTPESAHYENIRNNFTDILSAMWKVEDDYDWQFDQATYRDVFNRCRRIAADLDLAGLSLKAVGAEAVVRSALKDNGSLNDDSRLDRAVSDLMASPLRDRNLITLAPGFAADTASNPFSAPGAATTRAERQAEEEDLRDFGLLRSMRQELFRHRARSVNAGLGADDFTDYQTLQNGFVRAFRAFSTGSAAVDDKTFSALAKNLIASIRAGKQTSVMEAAAELAPRLSMSQADALGQWSRSLLMDTADGDRRLRDTAFPFIEEIAAQTGMSYKDPAMEPFIAQTYNIVKRSFLDRRTVANLDSVTAETTDDALWDDVKARMAPQLRRLKSITEAKNAQLAARAEQVAQARERAKDEGN